MAKAGDGKPRSSKRQAQRQLYKRLTEDQFQDFAARAQASGYADPQAFLTDLVLGETAFQKTERARLIALLGQIGKHGSNVNQIARSVNSGRVTVLSADSLYVIEEAARTINQASKEVREALRDDR